MGANSKQIGGDHYKKGGEEHWDRQWRLFGPGYFVGCITKYVERYNEKNGIEDLEKAKHFIEKLIELESLERGRSLKVQPESDKRITLGEEYKNFEPQVYFTNAMPTSDYVNQDK